jgi:hypothetical protein
VPPLRLENREDLRSLYASAALAGKVRGTGVGSGIDSEGDDSES